MRRTPQLLLLVCLLWGSPVRGQTADAGPQAGAAAPVEIPRNQMSDSFERLSATHWRYTGTVELDFGGGTTFFADEVDLFTDTGRLVAAGNVVFATPEGRLAADWVEYNIREGRGTFRGARGVMSLGAAADRAQFANQDPDVYFWGETIDRVGAREYRISRGGFTTCVQPTPRWEVSSSEVVLKINDYAIARHMVLRVKNVPLMYLPLLYYPIQDDDRATGFLMPTYGTSTLRGQAVSNAFFWAIGRSHDATFFHDWFTRTGQGVGTEYRYVTSPSSSGSFRLYRLNQKQATFTTGGASQVLPAETAYEFDVSAIQQMGRSLRAQANIGYFTSITTRQLYHQNIDSATRRDRRIAAGLMANFGSVSAGLYYLRSEVFSSATDSVVFGGTPRATVGLAPRSIARSPVYASLDASFAHLPDRTITGGRVSVDRSLSRFELSPSLRAPLSRLTFLSVNTTASYRTTYYSRRAGDSGALVAEPLTRNYASLRSDVVGPVLTKIWDTPGSRRTERMKHVIEPATSVEYVTAIANQRQVPVLADASDFVVGGSMRLTYGITNRLFFRARGQDGLRGATREFVTIGVQQSYYSNPEASRYDTTYVTSQGRPRPVELSPVALVARVSPSALVDANARLEYDVSGSGLQATTIGGSVGGGPASGSISFSRTRYSRASEPSTYVTGSTSLAALDRRLSGAYSLSWDIARGYIVMQRVTGAYLAQCCGIQLEFQKYAFPAASGYPVPADVRVNFGVVLAGLGTFSNFFGALGGPR